MKTKEKFHETKAFEHEIKAKNATNDELKALHIQARRLHGRAGGAADAVVRKIWSREHYQEQADDAERASKAANEFKVESPKPASELSSRCLAAHLSTRAKMIAAIPTHEPVVAYIQRQEGAAVPVIFQGATLYASLDQEELRSMDFDLTMNAVRELLHSKFSVGDADDITDGICFKYDELRQKVKP
jgi:hypothetical protein